MKDSNLFPFYMSDLKLRFNFLAIHFLARWLFQATRYASSEQKTATAWFVPESMNYYFDSFLGQLKGRHCTRQLFNWPIVALVEIKSAETLTTTKIGRQL